MTYYGCHLEMWEACDLRQLIKVVFVYGNGKECVRDLDLQKPILKAMGVDQSCSFAECFLRLQSNENKKS